MDEFCKEYRRQLATVVQFWPEEYPWLGRVAVETVADRMEAAIRKGSFNKDSRAFKATCKTFGIKHTYTAIKAFCNA